MSESRSKTNCSLLDNEYTVRRSQKLRVSCSYLEKVLINAQFSSRLLVNFAVQPALDCLAATVIFAISEEGKLTRIFLVVICGLALAVAPAAKAGKGKNTEVPNRNATPVGQGSQHAGGTTGKTATSQAIPGNRTIHQIGNPTTTGKSSRAQVEHGNKTVHRGGTSAGDGKRTTVGKSTETGTPTNVGNSTATARRQSRKAVITPKIQVAPAAQVPQNNATQLLNTSVDKTAPVFQLPQSGGVHLLNTPITETAPPLKFGSSRDIFATSTSVSQAAGTGLLVPPGGWRPQVNIPNRAGSESNSTGTGSPSAGSTVIPYNMANGPQTGTSISQPLNMPNAPLPEPPSAGLSTSQPAGGEIRSTHETAPVVQFKRNRRIQGSDRWVDARYEVFRNYRPEWHDRDWWRSHQSRVVFGVGGWYYWNAGYWFPAWGYDPNAYYPYDGPIYGYHDLPPDQVVANVQETLRQRGHYNGEVDGLLGLPTRTAIADYQRDHGLYETSTIDRPTSQSLGMK
jgi:Putative peptidoglycan binding domain